MINISTILKHYKRKEIQEAIIENAEDREIAIKFGDKGFGKRPDVLKYPRDILELAKQGATSFHASEERWKNPLQLEPTLKRSELEKLRSGWDLVLDIDCHFLEYSKIAADLVIKALKFHGIKSISCKFSGNKGFHIGVSYEAFPTHINGKEIGLLFPEAPRRIALYIKEMIKKPLGEELMKLENGNFSNILKKTKISQSEVREKIKGAWGRVRNYVLNTAPFLDIDTILISSRHLYRMAYTFNEKSNLVSVPVNPNKILEFNKIIAKPVNVRVSRFKFLDMNVKRNEARKLIVQAFDFSIKKEEEIKIKKGKYYVMPESALQEQFFPPCIKLILKGLEDGRKRSLFILINFLSSVSWDYDNIEKLLREWNKRNKEPLREVYLVGQLRYHKQHKKKILPPNCQNAIYYKDFGVCVPDNLCSKIKNPVNYSIRKTFYLKRGK